jgi:hypothetical protein
MAALDTFYSLPPGRVGALAGVKIFEVVPEFGLPR